MAKKPRKQRSDKGITRGTYKAREYYQIPSTDLYIPKRLVDAKYTDANKRKVVEYLTNSRRVNKKSFLYDTSEKGETLFADNGQVLENAFARYAGDTLSKLKGARGTPNYIPTNFVSALEIFGSKYSSRVFEAFGNLAGIRVNLITILKGICPAERTAILANCNIDSVETLCQSVEWNKALSRFEAGEGWFTIQEPSKSNNADYDELVIDTGKL